MRLSDCYQGRKVWIRRVQGNAPATVQKIGRTRGMVCVRLEDGKRITVPAKRLLPRGSTSSDLRLAEELHATTGPTPADPLPKAPPLRSRAYLEMVRRERCLAHGYDCPSPTREASHHPEPGHGSTGMKAGDDRTVPLCHEAHREYHRTYRIGGLSIEGTRHLIEEEIARLQSRWARRRTA